MRQFFFTHVWNDILTRINKVSKILQKPTLTLATTVTLLSSLTTFISKKRDSFDKYLTSAETAIGFKFEDCEKKRTIKRSLKIEFFDNPLTPESVHSEKEKLKIDVFLPMIDAIYINLRDRSSKYDIVAKRFGFLEEIITLKENDLEAACSTLAEKYEHDISSNELFEECIHLKCFLEEDKDLEQLLLKTDYEDESEDKKDGPDSTTQLFNLEDHRQEEIDVDDPIPEVRQELDCNQENYFELAPDEDELYLPTTSSRKLNLKTTYKYLHDNGLFSAFPNIEVILRILLCMMVSNASAERTFSKLKLVKSYSRSTMKQDRLNSLSILSIENDILRRLDLGNMIDDFAAVKCRKKSF